MKALVKASKNTINSNISTQNERFPVYYQTEEEKNPETQALLSLKTKFPLSHRERTIAQKREPSARC